ncbi:MAG: PIN domain-containing protein [Acidimicrobiia bacterium]|jgi:toxin-antitoxin system PIN domain toxin|nr:PIN domain-containing protein [Acidimicrobiia bacterium]
MIVDANVLLYARNESSEHHERAKAWLEGALNGDTRVGLPWWTLTAFVRIATNPRAFDRPLSAEEAAKQIEEWTRAPRAWIAEPSGLFADVFLRLIRTYRITAGLTTDAQLAALAIEHGVPLISADSDFSRFRELDWVNPFADAAP